MRRSARAVSFHKRAVFSLLGGGLRCSSLAAVLVSLLTLSVSLPLFAGELAPAKAVAQKGGGGTQKTRKAPRKKPAATTPTPAPAPVDAPAEAEDVASEPVAAPVRDPAPASPASARSARSARPSDEPSDSAEGSADDETSRPISVAPLLGYASAREPGGHIAARAPRHHRAKHEVMPAECPDDEALAAFVERRSAQFAVVEEHIDTCAACRVVVAHLAALRIEAPSGQRDERAESDPEAVTAAASLYATPGMPVGRFPSGPSSNATSCSVSSDAAAWESSSRRRIRSSTDGSR